MTNTDRDQTPRDGKGKWIKGVDSHARDAEALRLRAKSWTLRKIAEQLGYGNESNVRRALAAATSRIEAPDVEHYRQVEDAKLDQLEAAARKVLEARHLVLHQGQAVTHDGRVVTDDGPVLAAVATLVRISESRRKLWGLDAPTKIESSGQVRYEVVGVDLENLR